MSQYEEDYQNLNTYEAVDRAVPGGYGKSDSKILFPSLLPIHIAPSPITVVPALSATQQK
jgi:hypothetical protein